MSTVILRMVSTSRLAAGTSKFQNIIIGPRSRKPLAMQKIIRNFASEEGKKVERPSTMDSQKRKAAGDFSTGRANMNWKVFWPCIGILAVTYAGFRYLRNKKEEALEKERRRSVGKSKIGGVFELVNTEGKTVKSEEFIGKWVLLYFGFTHCPDVCPDEMEKMGQLYETLMPFGKKEFGDDFEVVPLFITVDPERDGVAEVKEYCKEFHPAIVGLTGSNEQILRACKAYRVYFSAGPRDPESDDYIVDHTIIIYLIDPEGQFVDYYGQTKNADMINAAVKGQIRKFYGLKKGQGLTGAFKGLF